MFIRFITGQLNDMWMFNITTKLWTWLTGNNSINAVGTYGNPGVTAFGNNPGGRNRFSMTLDSENQIIFVFGGSGYGASTTSGNFPKWYDFG